MIPSAANSDYPKFVADQVLTSDNLNDLFEYLDEQQRLTRVNLSGIGIVCGLEIKTATDGSSITITKGVGITSSGYLVSVPEVRYTRRTTAIFDAVKCEYYSKFVNISAKTQLFDLWELKQEGEEEGTTPLNNSFLSDGEKIVLIFVELLEANNKNCDPNSCDDKGIKVTVNFRPLLVERVNADSLLSGAVSDGGQWLTLPAMSMKRFDVTATSFFECLNFFKVYQKILNAEFLTNTQNNLSLSYEVLKPMLADEFPSNPFSTLANDFKFLNDGSMNSGQLINMQYYYDLFSDILLAYDEFRRTGIEVIGLCRPDDFFPRHLLLGRAHSVANNAAQTYRQSFIPSPILCDGHSTVTQLKILFRKLVLLTGKFAVPAPDTNVNIRKGNINIRITPSTLAGVPLSTKAIPYYYPIGNSSDALLKNWNPQKLLEGKITRNLSFHSLKYNQTDEDIRYPLLYDLEPYNFLRIEGHIGLPYQSAVRKIAALRDANRLPFEIVALGADFSAISEFLKNLGQLLSASNANARVSLESLMDTNCRFNDLELLYDSIMSEMAGKLSNEMKFFYDLIRDSRRQPLPVPASNVPQVPLLVKTDSTFRITNNSIGLEFEQFYPSVKDQAFIPMNVFLQSFGQDGNTDLMDFVFKAVLYYIEMLYETVTTGLGNFNFMAFYTRYVTLIQVVRYIKLLNKTNKELFPLSEEENDHLDALLSINADGRMVQLYFEFLRRILQVKIMQQAGYYVRCHPGIQHKAGVPMGGTFIVIYHEQTSTDNSVVGRPPVLATNVVGKVPILETPVFNIATGNVKPKTPVSEVRPKEGLTIREHLSIFSNAIDEKVFDAGERIVSGVKELIPEQLSGKNEPVISPGITNERKLTTTTVLGTAKGNATAPASQELDDYLLEAADYLKNRKSDPLDNAIEDWDSGIVIADFYLPYLCCSDCAPVQIVIPAESGKSNQLPIARPGDNASVQLPVNSITLDGSTSSDPDGTIKSYLWEKQSGPEAKIESPDQSKTVVSDLSEGVYEFKLTVTDDEGSANSAVVKITVLAAANVPPITSAVANPMRVVLNANNEGATELSGAASKDPDGVIKLFNWSLSSGPADGVAIENSNGAVTRALFKQPGTYVFKLVVTDDGGATGTTTVSVFVSVKENLPPVAVAKANPLTVIMSASGAGAATLDGSASSDPDGTIVEFSWKLTTGIPAAIADAAQSQTRVQFSRPGVYNFLLTVKDDKGATASDSVSITVNPVPVPEKKCAPLEDIISGFKKLETSDSPEIFKAFTDKYQVYKEIAAFYEKMQSEKISTLPVEQQIDFFLEQKIDARLVTWIEQLRGLTSEVSDMRLLALLMFTIHAELAYYIACIQKEDIDKAKVSMLKAVNSLVGIIRAILSAMENFSDKQKEIIAQFEKITTAERERVKGNNEEAVKVAYAKLLDAIIKLFS